jgi:hypothetical protein
MCVLIAFIAATGSASGQSNREGDLRATSLRLQSPVVGVGHAPAGRDAESCTVFFAADDRVALGGNNEDGTYGRMYVGYDDLRVQGGLNDQGLFFDGLAVRQVNVPHELGKPIYPGVLIEKAMAECGTVACVVNLFERYGLSHAAGNGHYLVGDRTGDSASIEPFGILRKDDRYQVATNFFQSEIPLLCEAGKTFAALFERLGATRVMPNFEFDGEPTERAIEYAQAWALDVAAC